MSDTTTLETPPKTWGEAIAAAPNPFAIAASRYVPMSAPRSRLSARYSALSPIPGSWRPCARCPRGTQDWRCVRVMALAKGAWPPGR
jgi:hypothetical protein